jgi:hypothetical protein
MAWVHLDCDEALAIHEHPVPTMIVVARGRGRMVGDLEVELEEGDVVAIPAGRLHGFFGGEGGYWALSVQFDGLGLYEVPEAARVSFASERSPGLLELLRRNERYASAYVQNPVFDLVREGHLQDPAKRARYLAALQVWSDAFHRLLLARGVTTSDPRFASSFRAHLIEEIDHSARLAAGRGEHEVIWDPTLDAASNWFVAEVLALDAPEKAVLVHLVLEVASHRFHEFANPLLAPYVGLDYFAVHEEADAEHELLCLPELDGLTPATYERLFQIQHRGWQMIELICSRLAALALA